MPSTAAHAPLTWDDFVALDEDDRRELIDGELVEVEVPNRLHERIVARLCGLLMVWSDSGHGGTPLASGYKVRISDRRGFMPDVQFYRKENHAADDQDVALTRGHPDLVVEVISPSSRRYDRVKKLSGYAHLGVPEYWIVDGEAQTVERLVLVDGAYVIAASVDGDDVFAPASFEGLTIPLAPLWGT